MGRHGKNLHVLCTRCRRDVPLRAVEVDSTFPRTWKALRLVGSSRTRCYRAALFPDVTVGCRRVGHCLEYVVLDSVPTGSLVCRPTDRLSDYLRYSGCVEICCRFASCRPGQQLYPASNAISACSEEWYRHSDSAVDDLRALWGSIFGNCGAATRQRRASLSDHETAPGPDSVGAFENSKQCFARSDRCRVFVA